MSYHNLFCLSILFCLFFFLLPYWASFSFVDVWCGLPGLVSNRWDWQDVAPELTAEKVCYWLKNLLWRWNWTQSVLGNLNLFYLPLQSFFSLQCSQKSALIWTCEWSSLENVCLLPGISVCGVHRLSKGWRTTRDISAACRCRVR